MAKAFSREEKVILRLAPCKRVSAPGMVSGEKSFEQEISAGQCRLRLQSGKKTETSKPMSKGAYASAPTDIKKETFPYRKGGIWGSGSCVTPSQERIRDGRGGEGLSETGPEGILEGKGENDRTDRHRAAVSIVQVHDSEEFPIVPEPGRLNSETIKKREGTKGDVKSAILVLIGEIGESLGVK